MEGKSSSTQPNPNHEIGEGFLTVVKKEGQNLRSILPNISNEATVEENSKTRFLV